MAKYIDGFVFVVPKNKIKAYIKMAKQGAKMWKKHGALQYFECKGDDLHPEHVTLTFPKLTKLKASETVWFSFIVYRSKKHRDAVNVKVMNDPQMSPENWKDQEMPFDMKRMSMGGFKSIVEY